MNRLLEGANRFLRQCDWRDLALIKLSVLSAGLLLGLAVPKRLRCGVAACAAALLAATCVPVLVKYLMVLKSGPRYK